MYLGLDIGTSGVKAILLSDAGEVVAQATARTLFGRSRIQQIGGRRPIRLSIAFQWIFD